MIVNDDIFIEVDFCQHSAADVLASGNVYFQKRYDDHVIAMLCDGGNSGVQANVLASTVASMVVNSENTSIINLARTTIEFIKRGRHVHNIINMGFVIMRVYKDLRMELVEYRIPPVMLFSEGKAYPKKSEKADINLTNGDTVAVHITNMRAQKDMMAICVTNGVLLSGRGSYRMPRGWSYSDLALFIEKSIKEKTSARDISHGVIDKAMANDLFVAKNDMSCACLYIRKPRRILVCTGPPYDKNTDTELAKMIKDYDGEVIISGGTTAMIVARELNREINVIMGKKNSGIPPRSEMEGVSMVTEGVLTLNKVKETLISMRGSVVPGKNVDAQMIRKLLGHDIIEFVVGTRINVLHQNPNIPVELALRRNVVKDIAHELKEKFLKEVTIKYL